MKLLYSGIHKNVGFLIQHIGGYDQDYHIIKLAEKLNLPIGDVSKIFAKSRRSNLNHYIELLENGMSVNKIFEMMEQDNEIATRKVRKTMAFMSGIIADSKYKNLF